MLALEASISLECGHLNTYMYELQNDGAQGISRLFSWSHEFTAAGHGCPGSWEAEGASAGLDSKGHCAALGPAGWLWTAGTNPEHSRHLEPQDPPKCTSP